MKKFLIVTAFALATPAMAADCPDKVIAAADHLGLNRAESFDASHPTYYLPASLDGGGLLVIDCFGATEVTMAVYSKKPNDRFMALFGAFAIGGDSFVRDCARVSFRISDEIKALPPSSPNGVSSERGFLASHARPREEKRLAPSPVSGGPPSFT
jgi:hypothetical protein